MYVPYQEVKLSELSFDPKLPVFFDTETDGLYGKICLAQFYQKGMPEVLLVRNPKPIDLMILLQQYTVVMHNAHYDITCIQEATGSRFCPKSFEDTFLLARIAYPAKDSFSLDDVMTYVLGFDPYEKQDLEKSKLAKSKWTAMILSDAQYRYAATDVYYLPEVYDAVKDFEDTTTYKLDKLTLQYCLDFQNNGMPIDNERLQTKYAENLKKIEELAVPINVNSYQQVRPYIDSDESDDLALVRLAQQGNKRAANVRTVRKLRKQNSFMDKFDTDEGRVFGCFKPSARSGRLTSNGTKRSNTGNQQQHPRALKGLFGYPTDDGRCMIYSDYAQIQLRGATVIAQEKKMEELFRNYEDAHDYTADMIFGKGWEKKHRQVSKTGNFNLLFGGGAPTFQNILLKQVEMDLPIEECMAFKKKWNNLWKGLTRWQQTGTANWRHGKLGSTPFGRKYSAQRMTDYLAMEIQGFEAEVAKLALHYMMPKMKALSSELLLCDFIHDSFIWESPCDPEIYEPASKILSHCMQEAWFEASKSVPIKDLPMPIDTRVGYNWAEIEEGNFFFQYELKGMEEYESL